MNIITKKMTTPIKINTQYETQIYDTYYQIKNLKQLFEIIYTHKHNYKPIMGTIISQYQLNIIDGTSIIYELTWEINTKNTQKIDYQELIITYDQNNKEHKNTIKINQKQRLPRFISTDHRKKIYHTLFTMGFDNLIVFSPPLGKIHSVDSRGVILELSQLSPEYRRTLPLTIEKRKEKYWQPPIP